MCLNMQLDDMHDDSKLNVFRVSMQYSKNEDDMHDDCKVNVYEGCILKICVMAVF